MTSRLVHHTQPMPTLPPQVSVALLGFGNVARAFVRYIQSGATSNAAPIRIAAVADSSGGFFLDDSSKLEGMTSHKEAGGSLLEFAPSDLIKDAQEFIREFTRVGVSVLVESLPTNIASGEPAHSLITSALEQGTSVVTVDKGPLVHGFDALMEAARKGSARIGYRGTTGVCIPDEIADDRVLEIRGVLNGTTNYVLTEMQQHQKSFDEALAAAQAGGIAEPDSSLDVQGWDTAAKILILAKSLMGADARLADLSRIGIGPETEALIRIARESGRMLRLVGRARIWQGRVRVSVAPKLLEPDSPFYSVSGTSKAAVFRTQRQGAVVTHARSGRDAISQTIMDDITRINSELYERQQNK